jgi:hypothetical protein
MQRNNPEQQILNCFLWAPPVMKMEVLVCPLFQNRFSCKIHKYEIKQESYQNVKKKIPKNL